MNSHESYPYQAEVESMLRQLHESYAIVRTSGGGFTVYLIFRGRFYALGSPGSIAYLSLEALADTIALAKRHELLGYERLPTGESLATVNRDEAGDLTGTAYPDPPPVPPAWLQHLDRPSPQRVQRPTVPLARLQLPTPVLHQLLQLPDDWSIKQVSIEEGNVCVYCLTPECAWLDVMSGMPVISADYQVEERDGRPWRAPISLLVKQGDYTVGGKFYVEDHRDTAIDL